MKKILQCGFLFWLLALQACDGFFNEKPNISLVVPQTLDDFQAILDGRPRAMNSTLSTGLLSSDDLILGPAILNQLAFSQVSSYFWREEFYLPDESDPNWFTCYRKVFHANLVIDGLRNYSPKTALELQRKTILEASAKFYRAQGHFESLSHYSPYSDFKTPNPMGIPIRLTSDLNVKVGRIAQEQALAQIIKDLEDGASLLPAKPEVPTRPSAWAAHAMLSRVHLYTKNYEKALFHAEKTLEIEDALMNYGEINPGPTYPFKIFNQEVIFYGELLSGRYALNTQTFVNPEIVRMYGNGDYRSSLFFRKSPVDSLVNFRGHYTGDYFVFGGLAVNEVVLNKAESAVRLGQTGKAREALNYLLSNRINPKNFSPINADSQSELLQKILSERRKELVFRGLRWLDLKRLNTEDETKVTMRRKYNPENSILPPGDPRYVIPIPPIEVDLNPLIKNP
ncbi:MAG: RagB/SusD family nutrient uptake outer membrane protein [Algoriphagus aquaeductus]|uniref:RagB/SusD family nutrient uptake outer membrane protein n=1 Tax=Algoriphagus aquaeductus TaxID=475299 RepID=UPI00391B871C